MDEIGQRLDELGRAVTRGRIPSGLADVRRRANRRRRNARAGTAVGTIAIVLAAGIGYGALQDRDPATVTSPAPSAQASPAPTPSPSVLSTPTPSPTPSPSPTPGRVTETTYPKPRPGELPRATIRELDGANTWQQADEGQQIGIGAQAATFTQGLRPRNIEPRMVEVDHGSVWVAATDGVARIDPASLQPVDYVPLGGRVIALATSGYAGMYAVFEGPDRSLGVATWEAVEGAARILHSFVLDGTPGSARTVRGDAAVDGFGEGLFLARTYDDRPGELVAVSVRNGTHEVLATMGGPGSTLALARGPGDGERHFWLGGSGGELWHVNPDGRVTELDVGGAIEDVEVADERVWLTVARTETRPVLVDSRTERILRDERGVVARHVAIEADRGRAWSSSGGRARGGVQIAMLDNDLGRAFTTATVDVAAIHDIVPAGDSVTFGVSPATGELIRLEAEFGE
ncbi:MAG TPA: hypothetical protein VNA14_05220 [Mycobacteriales bacterium]|nr:hypothetical protein [Mycobacteriales bacterium]